MNMIVDVEILMHLLYISLMSVVYNTWKSEIEVLHVDFFFSVESYNLWTDACCFWSFFLFRLC